MTGSYEVDVDVARSFLRIKLIGFFDVATVRRLAAERDRAVDGMHCGPNRHVTLCDAREALLSAADVATEFQRLLGDPRYASRRLAYVTVQALGRIQATRTLGRKDIAFFTEEAPALEWLFAEEVISGAA